MDNKIQKITPNLWFKTNAEEAVNFYVSIFKDASIGRMTRYSGVGNEIHGMTAGKVMTIEFQLEGLKYLALNGGGEFNFNEAISFIVNCDSQDEVDYYWGKLTEGGDETAQVCGWLKDKFGVSWQVVPRELDDMMMGNDQDRIDRVMRSLLQMKKLDLNELRRAYVGK